jgi:hypothetical protein
MRPGEVTTIAVKEVASACLSDLAVTVTTVTLMPKQGELPRGTCGVGDDRVQDPVVRSVRRPDR